MSARSGEHRYFMAAAVVVTALVLWAFAFEYRDLMHPSQFTLLVQVHGVHLGGVVPHPGGSHRHLPHGFTPAQFLASALTDLAAFALLAGSGLALRRRPDFHKRLMLLANMPPLIAALARLVAFLHLARAADRWRAGEADHMEWPCSPPFAMRTPVHQSQFLAQPV